MVAVACATALGAAACSGRDRFAVEWTEVAVSDDRRTVTVVNDYGPFCAIAPDGVEVDVSGDEIVVTAWMRTQTDGSCDAACEPVTQTTTDLAAPLPDVLPIVQRPGASLGCDS